MSKYAIWHIISISKYNINGRRYDIYTYIMRNMKNIYIKDIIKTCNAELLCGNEEDTLTDIVKDTREIKKSDTYIGFKGEHNDGNLFYNTAIENGAKICILQKSSVENKINLEIEEIKKKYNNVSIILVEDTIKALQEIAKFKRNMYNMPVVGITGSVGKTSTKDIIASVMSKKFNVLKTLGNYNNQIGLPITVLRLKDENAMVVEMGMNMPNEIRPLSKIAKPSVAVITNVGTAHIGNLGSRENILKAKLEILDGLQKDGILVINNDNDMLHNWYMSNINTNFKVVTFGMENKSDIMPYDIELSEEGSTYKIDIDGNTYTVSISVGGNHFVLNSLCAIAIGRIFGIPMEDILEGIANFELTKRRMQVERNKNGVTIINDCYNANYDSMKAAIEYLGKINAKKKIAILGDMLELGEFSKSLHEKVGEEVVNNNIDIIITVGTEAKYIVNKALEKGFNRKNIYICNNNEEAVEIVKKIASSEDAILLKASNGLNFQEIYSKICN